MNKMTRNIKSRKNLVIFTFLCLITLFYFMIPLINAQDNLWNFEEGEDYNYNILLIQDDVVQVEASFSIEINSITTSLPETSVSTIYDQNLIDFEIEITYGSTVFDNDSLFLNQNISLIYSIAMIEHYITELDSEYETLDTNYYDQYSGDDQYRYRIKKLSYGWEIKFFDVTNNINEYEKIQYNSQGVLLHYEESELNSEGEESSFKITYQSSGGGVLGIPGYSTAMILGILGFSILLVILKQNKKV